LLCTFPASAQYPGGGYFGGYPGSDGTGYQMTSQTGSQSVIHQDGQTRTIPYSATSSGYAGGVVTGWHPGGAANDASSSGQINTTFTWQPTYPGEPPPDSAILTQTCTAAYYGPMGGNCDDGLGSSHAYSEGGYTCSETKYTVQSSPGASFTATCSPSAFITGPANRASGATGSVSVYYSASLSPVTLTLSGTTKDSSGNLNILIGQGCSGSLSVGGFQLTDFQWTISGDTFAKYEIKNSTVPIDTTVASVGHVTYLSSDDLTSSSPHWYWKHGLSDPVGGTASGEPQTVSCTAQATSPITGLSIGTVTGQRKVSVWAPYHKFHYDLTSAPPTSYLNWGTSNVATESTISFDGSVGIPEFFYEAYAGTGIWQFTQLCQLSRVAIPSYYVVTNGYVLDAEFNYSSGQGSPWYADAVLAANQYTTHFSSDSPSQPLSGPPQIGINDSYWTYMMFQPPGADVSWVPIHKMERQWQAALHSFLAIYWYADPPGTLKVSSDVPSSEFPIWQDVYIDKNVQ